MRTSHRSPHQQKGDEEVWRIERDDGGSFFGCLQGDMTTRGERLLRENGDQGGCNVGPVRNHRQTNPISLSQPRVHGNEEEGQLEHHLCANDGLEPEGRNRWIRKMILKLSSIPKAQLLNWLWDKSLPDWIL